MMIGTMVAGLSADTSAFDKGMDAVMKKVGETVSKLSKPLTIPAPKAKSDDWQQVFKTPLETAAKSGAEVFGRYMIPAITAIGGTAGKTLAVGVQTGAETAATHTESLVHRLHSVTGAMGNVGKTAREGFAEVSHAMLSPLHLFDSMVEKVFSLRNMIMGTVIGEGLKEAIMPAIGEEKNVARMTGQFGGNKEVAERWNEVAKKRGSLGVFNEDEYRSAIKSLNNLAQGYLLSEKNIKGFEDVAVKSGQSVSTVAMQYSRMADMLIVDPNAKISPILNRMQRMGGITAEVTMQVRQLEKAGASNAAIWSVVENSLQKSQKGMAALEETTAAHIGKMKLSIEEAFEGLGTPILASIKTITDDIREKLDELTENGALQEGGKKINETFLSLWRTTKNVFSWIEEHWEGIKSVLLDVSIVVGILTLSKTILTIADAFKMAQAAAALLGIEMKTLALNPLILAGTAIVGAAVLLKQAGAIDWAANKMYGNTPMAAYTSMNRIEGNRSFNPMEAWRKPGDDDKAAYERMTAHHRFASIAAMPAPVEVEAPKFTPGKGWERTMEKLDARLGNDKRFGEDFHISKLPKIALDELYNVMQWDKKSMKADVLEDKNKLEAAEKSAKLKSAMDAVNNQPVAMELQERKYAGAAEVGSVEAYRAENSRYDLVEVAQKQVDLLQAISENTGRMASASSEPDNEMMGSIE